MSVQVFAKVLVLRPDNQVLVLKRSATDDRRPGEWDFPGGTVDAGEGPDEGAAREVMEEAGLTVDAKQLKLLYAATSFYEPSQDSNTRMFFLAKVSEAEAETVRLSHEHSEFKWQTLEAAADDHPHAVYKAALLYALEHSLL